MLIKIDIAKAYDMIKWKAVLATLHIMQFPQVWIDRIMAYISSPSFSFLINGKPSDWISGSRGLRQRDPTSPYLFLIVAQNLSTVLNFALAQNWIPGFDVRLYKNFNYLMFADDLILITRVSCKVARACKLGISIYRNLIGQLPKVNRSTIHFPSWFNRRMCKSISNILGIRVGSYHFKYLSCLISPKKLNISHQQLVLRTQSCIQA